MTVRFTTSPRLAGLLLALTLSTSAAVVVRAQSPAAPDASAPAPSSASPSSAATASTDAPAQPRTPPQDTTRALDSFTTSKTVGPAGVPFAEARAQLKDLLAHGEFERIHKRDLGRELQQYIASLLSKLVDRLVGHSVSTDIIGTLLAWGFAIAAFIVVALWLLRLRRTTVTPRMIEASLPRLTSREWAERARAALASGDPREAIRCGYHAALFRLEEQGVWMVDEARTPREYLLLLPSGDARRAALVSLTRDFELTWYGSRVADTTGLLQRLEVFGCVFPPASTI